MGTDLVLRRHSTAGVEERISPAASDALTALELLDGRESSELSVTDHLTAGIFVVGGPDRYVCWVQRWGADGELDFHNASDPAQMARPLKVTLSNGEADEFPGAQTIDRSAVARALRSYVVDRALDPSIMWVSTDPR